jgi:tetratricopeptide (TPR) repeat protein
MSARPAWPGRWAGRVLLALVLAVVALPAVPWAAERPADHVEFYVDSFGLADPASEPRVARAHAVFARVRAAAAVQGRRLPRLKVLAAADPWAQALPDGYILLSRGAVAICDRDADPALGDTRLAFVLGHELAHLAKDDFWHGEVHRALAGDPQARASYELLAQTSDADPTRLAETRLKEAEADDWGFVYAAVAGYPVHRLLTGNASGEADFFHFWVTQTQVQVLADAAHPAPADRAALLRNRLARMLGDIELWRFGVRLLQADRLDDARHFFERFQSSFPSREVFGNLGYLSLRQAMRRLPAPLAERFWMPTLFDLETRAAALAAPSDRDAATQPPPEAVELLETAAEYLERAVALDPDYTPAWTNLAIARLFLGQAHLARHAVERALAGSPDDPALGALQAVVIAESDPTLDLWPQAIQRLDALVQSHPLAPAVRYNLARLLSERGRTAAAEPHWSWLRTQADALPGLYARAVCGRESERHPECPPASVERTPPLPWPLPVPTGADLYQDPALAARLDAEPWEHLSLELGGQRLHGAIHWQPSLAAVLVLDGYVDSIALYGPDLGRGEQLRARVGAPRAIRTLPGAEIWTYGDWSVVVRDGQVAEVWVSGRVG